uniref:Uncharacterized protein n=1 Tax=Arundo donax TaxID=35708 RepID=A0A0A9GKT3_ARUDO
MGADSSESRTRNDTMEQSWRRTRREVGTLLLRKQFLCKDCP